MRHIWTPAMKCLLVLCVNISPWEINISSQSLQETHKLPLWARLCSFMLVGLLNDFPHSLHLKFLSVLCFVICLFWTYFDLRIHLQISHLTLVTLALCVMFLWTKYSLLVKNVSLQLWPLQMMIFNSLRIFTWMLRLNLDGKF